MTGVSQEVQMERLDGKLEKHIGITETILRNQEHILEEIREELKQNSQQFLRKEDIEAIHDSVLLSVEKKIDSEIAGFESRIDKRDKQRWGLFTFVISTGITIAAIILA